MTSDPWRSFSVSTTSLARTEAASLQGMAMGIGAYTLFAVHDALIKGIIHDLPAVQILFARSVVIMTLCMIAGRGLMLNRVWASPNRLMILGRGLLTLAAWVMYYSAGRDLQLAEMTTLYYLAPVLTTVLAVIFLKEGLTLARVGAASIGFFGVVVAADPGDFTLSLPVILVLLAAFCWAVAMILMRTISKSESALVQVYAQNLIHALAMGAVSLPFWQGMTGTQIAFCLAAGLVGGLAQFVLVEAAKLVPASVLGTVEYGALIWAFVFGYMFWAEMPLLNVYLGAALVIVAGSALAWTEHRSRREQMRR
ncbi:EamA family transporter [Nostoc sp. 3335mG]|nr:EamA family transporter [Nostoc sp. 3335mG]